MSVALPANLPPPPAPKVGRREFESMVDSSLRIADRVDSDSQDIHGELFYMRHCRWVYLPFRFRLVYHVAGDDVQVVCFQAQRAGGRWRPVLTTESYRRILLEADAARRAAP